MRHGFTARHLLAYAWMCNGLWMIGMGIHGITGWRLLGPLWMLGLPTCALVLSTWSGALSTRDRRRDRQVAPSQGDLDLDTVVCARCGESDLAVFYRSTCWGTTYCEACYDQKGGTP